MGTGGSEGGVWAGRSAPDFVKWPCPKLRSAGSPRRRPSTAKRRRLIARNFAVHLTKFPRSPTENSLFFAQGILVLRRRSSGHFRCVSNGNSLQIEKIPCKFPYSREFARGDRFDAGCIHRQSILRMLAALGYACTGVDLASPFASQDATEGWWIIEPGVVSIPMTAVPSAITSARRRSFFARCACSEPGRRRSPG